MKHHAFRYALIWTLLLLLLTACTGGQKPAANDANEQILAQLNDMKQELESAKNELNALKQEGQTVSIDTSTVENAPVATTRPEAVVTEVEVPVGATSKNAMVPMTTVNTKNILFIAILTLKIFY